VKIPRNMSDEYFYVRFRFSPKIGVRTAPSTRQHEAVVEGPRNLVQRKKLEYMNENPRLPSILRGERPLLYFQPVSNGLHGRMMKMRFGAKIALPS
jgi:hypothetical protein